jgi:hypothetical protein
MTNGTPLLILDAVDRILLNLISLGFKDIIRIGSLKKIAKSILPFSCPTKANDVYSHDLKVLYSMLEDENLADSEKKGFPFNVRHYRCD